MADTQNSRRTFMALSAAVPAALALSGVASAQTAKATPATLPGAGRAAIVTGSSRGIGAATARRLARDGYAVTVNYLTNRDLAAQVVRDIEAAGGRAIVRQADVADPAAVKALFDANDKAFGGVDVVVNNAGIMNVGPFAQMTDAAFDRMMATNVKGSFNVLREAARRTRDGGRIISLSSSIIQMKPAATGAYTVTKAAQEVYSSVLAKELAGAQHLGQRRVARRGRHAALAPARRGRAPRHSGGDAIGSVRSARRHRQSHRFSLLSGRRLDRRSERLRQWRHYLMCRAAGVTSEN